MLYFFKSSLRKISKQKVTSIINLAGLVLSISTFLIIATWIRSELSYDRFWDGYDRTYRVTLTRKVNENTVLNTAMNYTGAGQVLQNELPEIERATTLGKDIITAFTAENSCQDVNFCYIDSSFFKVFPRPLVFESLDIFADIHGAILSQSMAKKLFGNKDPLNRKFKINEGWEFFVCAIFEDFPDNSHLKFDMLIQRKALFYYMSNFNYETGILNNDNISGIAADNPYGQGNWSPFLYWYTYVKLQSEKNNIADLESKYKKTIQPCIKHIQDAGEEVEFTFQPISDIHLKSKLNDEISVNGSSFRLKAFGIIGILIVMISWFNYINLSMAVHIKQAAKDHVKRIIGASKGHLFLQHIVETLSIHASAGIISLGIVVLALRKGIHLNGINSYAPNHIELSVTCFILVITGTLISSFYPFYKIAGMRSVNILKKNIWSGPSQIFSRQSLVILQFSVAILLIICTSMVFKQIWFMQKQDLGVRLNQIMVSYSPMTMIKKPSREIKLKAFQDEVMRSPGVVSFTTAETIPGKSFKRTSSDVNLDDAQENKYLFSLANIDQNYFDFFSIKIMAGSNFLSSSDYDGNKVIVNAMACKRLGIPDNQAAIDRTININNHPYQIIGVVDDYHHLSLKDEIAPAIFFKSQHWHLDVGYYCVKVLPVNLESTISKVNKTWDSLYPDEPYLFSFLDDSFNALYNEDKKFGSSYMLFSLIAIFIAGMGLFALARILAESKIKEIGIRKVNGASTVKIMTMLNKSYLKWVTVAFVIACPIAWYVLQKWLQNFAFKTALSWWIFIIAGAITMIIALITVSWQSWQAATRNPVEALRYE